jgi:hypothetical protein
VPSTAALAPINPTELKLSGEMADVSIRRVQFYIGVILSYNNNSRDNQDDRYCIEFTKKAFPGAGLFDSRKYQPPALLAAGFLVREVISSSQKAIASCTHGP